MAKTETVVLKVVVHCDGCLRKIKRSLNKLEGVDDIRYDLKEGKVTLSGNINPQKVLKAVRKTGKQVELLQPKESKEADKKDSEQKDSNKKVPDKKEGGSKGSDKKESGKTASGNKDSSGKSGEDPKKLVYAYPENDMTFMFSEDNPDNCSIM